MVWISVGEGGGGKNAEAWNASGINWPVAPGEHKITNHTARKKVKWSLKKVWFSFFLDSFVDSFFLDSFVDLTQAAFLLKTILYRPIPLISVLFGLYFSFYSSLIYSVSCTGNTMFLSKLSLFLKPRHETFFFYNYLFVFQILILKQHSQDS